MLESMRNHAQSWLAKLILGGVALSFVLWGVGDYFFGSRVETVATINDKPIGSTEFYQAYERQLGAYRSMLGKQYSKTLIESLHVRENTLQTIINRRVMLDVASQLGLTAPESVLLSTVRNNPAFQSAGNFDPKRYQILTRNMGFGSAQDYENDLRLNIVVDALQKAMIGSAQVSDDEIRDRFNHDFEQRVLAAIVVDPATQLDSVTVDQTQAKSWYEAHKNAYKSPLRIKVNAVEINPRSLAQDMTVSDAEIKAAYEERKAEFLEPEQRRARHILIAVPKGSAEDVYKAARKKAESIRERIKAGEDFAKLAKELSDDKATAGKGGELGWFKASVMAPEFDQAVFAMDEDQLSDPVESQLGIHLIQLEEVRAAHQADLAGVKENIRTELVQKLAADEAYKLSQDLDDALGMEDSLSAAAASLDLKLFASDFVSQSDAEVTPLLTDTEVRNKAFATLPGQPVEIVETADGRFVALEVAERQEPEVLPFEQVISRVKVDARLEAANQKAREVADAIRSSSDKSLDELAQQYGQAKYISKPVRSSGTGDQAAWLTRPVLDLAFQTKSAHWLKESLNVPQGYAAVRVERVIAPSDEQFAKQMGNISREAVKTKGQVRFARWLASVRKGYEIVINEKVLERF